MPETQPRALAGVAPQGRVSVWTPPSTAPRDHVRLLVTTRRGGVSAAPWDSLNLSPSTGDERDDVESNRDRLRADTGMPQPRWLHQVHGDVVVDATTLDSIPGGTLQADGLWTTQSGMALAIGIADCVPLFLWDTTAPRLAVLHAGWRGTAQGILRRGIDTLVQAGAQLRHLALSVGPSIGPCCYQVGDEVASQLPDAITTRDGARYADLRRANHLQALDAGLPADHIDDAPPCTACHTDWFFSHRKQGPATGRMWAIAWIPSNPD